MRLADLAQPTSPAAWAAETVVHHIWGDLAPEVDLEGYLLAAATTLDVSGVGFDNWSGELKSEVLEALPVLDQPSPSEPTRGSKHG